MEFNLSTVSFLSENNFTPIDPDRVYDVVIIGGGPAGLTAAVYCMRKGVDTAIIANRIGGQVAETSSIENYMGYRYVNGIELVEKFREQVQQFSIGYDEGNAVESIEDDGIKRVMLENGIIVKSRTLIIASGKSWRKLGVPGEQRLTGRGVAYCTICDAPLFASKKVVVVGGGNSAVGAAIDLAGIAGEVVLVHRRTDFRADKILTDKLAGFKNVSFRLSSTVVEINGADKVSSVTLQDTDSHEKFEVETDGVFVEIGLDPNSSFAAGVVEMNPFGEIVVDSACRTSRDGIFAAGDVTTVPFKQIIIAAGEGANAALSACDYLMNKE